MSCFFLHSFIENLKAFSNGARAVVTPISCAYKQLYSAELFCPSLRRPEDRRQKVCLAIVHTSRQNKSTEIVLGCTFCIINSNCLFLRPYYLQKINLPVHRKLTQSLAL